MYRLLFLFLVWLLSMVHTANAQSVLYQKFTAPTSETMVQSLTDERLTHLQTQFYATTELQRREQLTRWEFLKIVIEGSGKWEHTLGHQKHSFPDIKGKYERYIAFAYNNNIINGYPDGTFKPNNPISRAEATKILVQALNIPLASAQTQFNDIPASNTLGRYIQTAYNNKLINGTSPTTFNPNATISRGELIKIVYNIQVGTGMERIIVPHSDIGATKLIQKNTPNPWMLSINTHNYDPKYIQLDTTINFGRIQFRSYSQETKIQSVTFKIIADNVYDTSNINLVSMIENMKWNINGRFKRVNNDTFEYIFDNPIAVPNYDTNNLSKADIETTYTAKINSSYIPENSKFIEIYLQDIKYTGNVDLHPSSKMPMQFWKWNFLNSSNSWKIEVQSIKTKEIQWEYSIQHIGTFQITAMDKDISLSSFGIWIEWIDVKNNVEHLKMEMSTQWPIDVDKVHYTQMFEEWKMIAHVNQIIKKWESVKFAVKVTINKNSQGPYKFYLNSVESNAGSITGIPIYIGSLRANTSENKARFKIHYFSNPTHADVVYPSNVNSVQFSIESSKDTEISSITLGINEDEVNNIDINYWSCNNKNTIVTRNNNIFNVKFKEPLKISSTKSNNIWFQICPRNYNSIKNYTLDLMRIEGDIIINNLPIKDIIHFRVKPDRDA